MFSPLVNVTLNKFFGSRNVIGEKEFKQKLCGSFNIDNREYKEVLKDLKTLGSIDYQRGVVIRRW